MKRRKNSPCIDVCKYQGPKGWCTACGMTRSESKGWKAMKPFGKKALLAELVRRQVKLKALSH
tara:strand:- start:75 stop:263 length:189 start_codon:yes stop_codon:yes gene_type:complete